MNARVLRISDEVDEIQVWNDNALVGAGAWTVPYDLNTAIQAILDVAMGKYNVN